MRKKAEIVRTLPKKIEKILIFFGGIDLTNETSKTLDALDKIAMPNLNVDVVIGAKNPRLHEIRHRIEEKVGYRFLVQVENMAELILNAQLAIGAGGTNSWERLLLGLPSLVISVASNQRQSCEDLAKLGCHYYLGEYNSVSSDLVAKALIGLIDHSNETRLSGLKAMQLIDGHGCMYVAQAFIDEINEQLI
jgi:UDP-2,4-diacetamido-2,4,6-trideoxy-beta-L-altropyranose hydrolase